MSEFHDEFREAAIKGGAMEAPEQPRDEEGKFSAEEETVAEVVEEVVETPEVEEPKVFAGKYKTPEELEKAYTELQSKLGQQSQQVAEAKRIEAELAAIREKIEKPAQPQYDLGEVANWFDENPTLISQTAHDAALRQDWTLYNAAMDKWHEYAPRQAAAYERQMELQALKSEFETKLASATAPVQLAAQKQAADLAVKTVLTEFPEMANEDFAQAMKEEAQNAPWLASIIETGDPAQLEQALRSLALMAKGRLADTLVAVAQKDGATQKQANTEAKQEAAVLSAATTSSREPANPVETWREDFRNSTEYKKAAGLI